MRAATVLLWSAALFRGGNRVVRVSGWGYGFCLIMSVITHICERLQRLRG